MIPGATTVAILLVLLGVVAAAGIAAVADRIARANAWRRIAVERRWHRKHDRRRR